MNFSWKPANRSVAFRELERQRGESQLLQASAPKQQLLQQIKQLQEELASWQEKCHSLQLTRLRLQQSLKQQRQNTSEKP